MAMTRSEAGDKLAAFIYPEGETLLGVLCYAAKRQGGTIHQYFPQGLTGDVVSMQDAFLHLRTCGIRCHTKAALDKLASQYHLTIKWA